MSRCLAAFLVSSLALSCSGPGELITQGPPISEEEMEPLPGTEPLVQPRIGAPCPREGDYLGPVDGETPVEFIDGRTAAPAQLFERALGTFVGPVELSFASEVELSEMPQGDLWVQVERPSSSPYWTELLCDHRRLQLTVDVRVLSDDGAIDHLFTGMEAVVWLSDADKLTIGLATDAATGAFSGEPWAISLTFPEDGLTPNPTIYFTDFGGRRLVQASLTRTSAKFGGAGGAGGGSGN